MHDQTAIKTEGIDDLFRLWPQANANANVEVDDGYRGLARTHPAQVSVPPKKPGKDATDEETTAWRDARHAQSSRRTCVEYGIAEMKHWQPLQRYTGRREHLHEAITAIGSIVSDRALTA